MDDRDRKENDLDRLRERLGLKGNDGAPAEEPAPAPPGDPTMPGGGRLTIEASGERARKDPTLDVVETDMEEVDTEVVDEPAPPVVQAPLLEIPTAEPDSVEFEAEPGEEREPPALPAIEPAFTRATPTPPPPTPSPRPQPAPALASTGVAGPLSPIGAEEWALERSFFHREARALAERQPERAAQMFLQAAGAAERSNPDPEGALLDAEAALALRPDSRWLLPAARRLFLRHRRFDRGLELGQREVELGGENAWRAAVLQESAAVLRFQKGKAREALGLLEQALSLVPTSLLLLSDTVGLRTELGLKTEAATGLEQLASAISTAEERSLCLYAAGSLRDEVLDEAMAAEADYRAAVEADRQSLPAVMAYCHHYERRALYGQLCSTLELFAQLVRDPSVEARLLHRAGSLHLDRTGDLEMAARDLTRAAQAAPASGEILRRLAYVQEARGRGRELIGTLQRQLELTSDAQSRAALHTHIGWLLQTRVGEIEEAIGAYRQALQAVDGYLPALQSLSTLYRHRGDWEELLAIYAPEVEGSLPARGRAVRCLEMAEILVEQLNRPEEAMRWYVRALELDEGLYPAFWGLAALLRGLGKNDVLGELLARQAERSTDTKTRNHLLLELAQLQAGPQNEVERAIETLEGMRESDRTRQSALLLLRLYERSGRHAEMTSFLQELARDTSDPAEAQGRRLEAAGIFEQKLQEPEKALELYRQILEQDTSCVAALRGAGRIYHRLAAWNELVKLHYHELRSDPNRPDTAIVLCRIGRILEENLGQVPAAIKAYSKALERDPSCAPALPALERLVRGARRWDDLVQVLQSHAAARMDARLAAEVLCRAAEVAEVQLEDLPRAANLYLNAQVLHPENQATRHGLCRVYRRQGNWGAMADVLKELIAAASSVDERALLQLELARVCEFRLGQPPDPELYEQAAQSLGARLRLERTRVLRQVGSHELVVWLERLGGESLEPGFGGAQFLESAYRRELCGAGESALDSARAAFQRQPEELSVIWALERALWQGCRFAELAQLREKEAQLELDPAVRVGRLITAANAHLQAGEAGEARRLAQQCLNFDAHCLPALRLLALLAEREKAWAELASLHDRLAEACTDADNRLESCVRAADLWSERVFDTARALASLAVALTDQPAHPEAFARAERLLRAGSRFAELSRLYRRRIKAAPEHDRVELMRQHARLLRDDLRDAGQAIQQLNELLVVAPADSGALLELVDLLVAQKHWSDAAAKLAALEARAGDPELRHRARLRQAELWLHHLHEPRRAQEILAAALEERPTDLEAKRRMAELCTLEGNWDGARQILESLLTEDDPQVAVWAGLQLTDVARIGLRDEELARRHESEALRVTVGSPSGLSELVEHYRRRRELDRFVKLGEEHLAQLNVGERPRLRAAVGRVLLEELQAPARALEHLRKGLASEAEDEELRLLLAAALEKQGELGPAADECRFVLEADPASIAAYRTLARIGEGRGQHALVAAAAGIVDLLGATDPEETALLKSLEGTGSPAGSLDPTSLSLPEHLASSQRVLASVLTELAALFPLELPAVLPANHSASAAVSRLARALGLSGVSVAIVEGAAGAEAGIGSPVRLAISPALARSPGEGVFRFWVGRALFSAVTGSALLERLDDHELADLAAALCGAKVLSAAAQQRRKELGRILPRKLRKQLESTSLPTEEGHWAALRNAERMRADQAGLLFSRTPRDGLAELGRIDGRSGRALLGSPRLAPLIRFVLSDDYARLAGGLWA
jgi:cellulose synthase operon protein C